MNNRYVPLNNDRPVKGSDTSREIVRPDAHLHISAEELGASRSAGRGACAGNAFYKVTDACAQITTLHRLRRHICDVTYGSP